MRLEDLRWMDPLSGSLHPEGVHRLLVKLKLHLENHFEDPTFYRGQCKAEINKQHHSIAHVLDKGLQCIGPLVNNYNLNRHDTLSLAKIFKYLDKASKGTGLQPLIKALSQQVFTHYLYMERKARIVELEKGDYSIDADQTSIDSTLKGRVKVGYQDASGSAFSFETNAERKKKVMLKTNGAIVNEKEHGLQVALKAKHDFKVAPIGGQLAGKFTSKETCLFDNHKHFAAYQTQGRDRNVLPFDYGELTPSAIKRALNAYEACFQEGVRHHSYLRTLLQEQLGFDTFLSFPIAGVSDPQKEVSTETEVSIRTMAGVLNERLNYNVELATGKVTTRTQNPSLIQSDGSHIMLNMKRTDQMLGKISLKILKDTDKKGLHLTKEQLITAIFDLIENDFQKYFRIITTAKLSKTDIKDKSFLKMYWNSRSRIEMMSNITQTLSALMSTIQNLNALHDLSDSVCQNFLSRGNLIFQKAYHLGEYTRVNVNDLHKASKTQGENIEHHTTKKFTIKFKEKDISGDVQAVLESKEEGLLMEQGDTLKIKIKATKYNSNSMIDLLISAFKNEKISATFSEEVLKYFEGMSANVLNEKEMTKEIVLYRSKKSSISDGVFHLMKVDTLERNGNNYGIDSGTIPIAPVATGMMVGSMALEVRRDQTTLIKTCYGTNSMIGLLNGCIDFLKNNNQDGLKRFQNQHQDELAKLFVNLAKPGSLAQKELRKIDKSFSDRYHQKGHMLTVEPFLAAMRTFAQQPIIGNSQYQHALKSFTVLAELCYTLDKYN